MQGITSCRANMRPALFNRTKSTTSDETPRDAAVGNCKKSYVERNGRHGKERLHERQLTH